MSTSTRKLIATYMLQRSPLARLAIATDNLYYGRMRVAARQLEDGPTDDEVKAEEKLVDELRPLLVDWYMAGIGTDELPRDHDTVVERLVASSDDIAATILVALLGAVEIGVRLGLEELGEGGEMDLSDIEQMMSERVDLLLDPESDISILRTTANDIIDKVMAEEEKDTDDAEILALLITAVPAWAAVRAPRIAMNELVGGTRTGMLEAYRRAGVEVVTFITQRDERVDDAICKPLDGRDFPIDDAPEIPYDTHIGCRCFYRPGGS